MKRTKTVLIATLAFLAAFALDLTAQSPNYFERLKMGANASNFVSAIKVNPAMICKYIGSNPLGGTITVSGANISFAVGAVGTSAADTTFECPVSGALGGIIDTSNAACNTVGEVLDIVNTATSDFACVAPALLRADVIDTSFNALSEAAANAKEGLSLLLDESASPYRLSILLAPSELQSDISQYRSPQNRAGTFVANPWKGYKTDFWKSILQSTYSSGSSTLTVVNVVPDLNAKSETVTTFWSQAAGATATDQTLDWTAIGGYSSRADSKILIRITNSAVMSAAKGSISGVMYPTQQ